MAPKATAGEGWPLCRCDAGTGTNRSSSDRSATELSASSMPRSLMDRLYAMARGAELRAEAAHVGCFVVYRLRRLCSAVWPTAAGVHALAIVCMGAVRCNVARLQHGIQRNNVVHRVASHGRHSSIGSVRLQHDSMQAALAQSRERREITTDPLDALPISTHTCVRGGSMRSPRFVVGIAGCPA